MKERIRYQDPVNPSRFDDQVTLGVACLFALPGVPCVYYGTEQGLHGSGSDAAVREALWGGPGFATNSKFFKAIQQTASIRAAQPALRYGRFYFRPVSGDGANFGVSPFSPGVVAFVEIQLSQAGDQFEVLYSNQSSPAQPQPVRTAAQGSVEVQEVDGSTGTGPLNVVRVTLKPLEVQILRNKIV
jgi:glycosidase